VQSRTFGHRYDSPTANQPGGRHRHYHNYGTSYAALSSIAGDALSGVTFYVQALAPADNENTAPSLNTLGDALGSPPIAGFRAPSDSKLSPPWWPQVWIVMVY